MGTIHTLEREQFIPAPIESVWAFFATPMNLDRLTPQNLKFEMRGKAEPMHAGQMIEYRIRLAPLVRVTWLTEIVHVEAGRYFVDEQRIGPYRIWHHQHRFAPEGKGTRMTDRVTYALPLGWAGDVAHALWVGRQLREIFDYRQAKTREIFGRS